VRVVAVEDLQILRPSGAAAAAAAVVADAIAAGYKQPL